MHQVKEWGCENISIGLRILGQEFNMMSSNTSSSLLACVVLGGYLTILTLTLSTHKLLNKEIAAKFSVQIH